MEYEEEISRLVDKIKKYGILKNPRIEKALYEAPRHLFVPDDMKKYAYQDFPLPIGYGQTISQPSTVVYMTEKLDIKENDKILEIGCGSGWQAAILSKLTDNYVYSIERIPELIEFAKNNFKRAGIDRVKIIEGDGSLGYEEEAPYDKIIVTAACPDIPDPLIEQLKNEGRLIAPVGNKYFQNMVLITKKDGKITKEYSGSFRFVPLVGEYGFEG